MDQTVRMSYSNGLMQRQFLGIHHRYHYEIQGLGKLNRARRCQMKLLWCKLKFRNEIIKVIYNILDRKNIVALFFELKKIRKCVFVRVGKHWSPHFSNRKMIPLLFLNRKHGSCFFRLRNMECIFYRVEKRGSSFSGRKHYLA